MARSAKTTKTTTESKVESPSLTIAATTSVPAAARAMSLFEVFARERRELTKSELARLLNLPESSCSDLLSTLYDIGYITRSVESKRYYPTGRLLNSAKAISENDPLTLFGAEATSLLSKKVDETCTFGVLDGERVKMVSVYEGTQRLRYVVNIGDRVSLHGTAVGKALLGALPPTERGRLLRLQPLRRLTPDTTTNPADLEREIERDQKQGWFTSKGEGAPGVWSLAISGFLGTTPVGLSMIGPSDRMLANKDKFVKSILEIKEVLFERSGGTPAEDAPRRGRGRPRRV
jgi:DNA-binding IclR family transcriptional regulator